MSKTRKSARRTTTLAPDKGLVRERILDAAFAAFMLSGYSGASTLKIATMARVSKRELYALFGSKRALLAAGIKERTERMSMPLDFPDIDSRQALARTLKNFGVTLLVGLTDAPVIALYRLAVTESDLSPELAATLNAEGREASIRALAKFLGAAQARRLVTRNDTPEDMAGQFCGLVLGDVILRLLLRVSQRPTPGEIESRAQTATELFLRLHAAQA